MDGSAWFASAGDEGFIRAGCVVGDHRVYDTREQADAIVERKKMLARNNPEYRVLPVTVVVTLEGLP